MVVTSQAVSTVTPNPSSEVLYVNLPDAQMDHLQIKDILGRTVYNLGLEGRTGTIKIDLSDLSQGVYFVTVKSKGDTLGLSKFIKR